MEKKSSPSSIEFSENISYLPHVDPSITNPTSLSQGKVKKKPEAKFIPLIEAAVKPSQKQGKKQFEFDEHEEVPTKHDSADTTIVIDKLNIIEEASPEFNVNSINSKENEMSSGDRDSNIEGAPAKGSTKACLYELCAANYWKPPSFECIKEEGPSHQKMFTFKVILEIEEASNLVVECFGAPQSKKKAAAEHAAEGTLWYLNHLGYFLKQK